MQWRSFLGGHPVAVVVRLVLLSILVGVLLSAFGITPRNFFATIDGLARWVYDLGFSAVEWLLEYLVLGAMVVVPLFLLNRLLSWSGDKQGPKSD